MQTTTPALDVQEKRRHSRAGVLQAFRNHWPEYLIEGAALGLFMISACSFGVLLEHPSSAVNQAIDNGFVRRILAGFAMGLTAIGIITSPWGKRSGAHMNPAVTLSYALLGKVAAWDAVLYVLFQFLGGAAGVGVASVLLGPPLAHSAVNFVATEPGPGGVGVAFGAEFAISAIMMSTILLVSNSRKLARFTPFFAGALVAAYISLEAPLSGMSMNPARTFASAYFTNEWMDVWIYFTAPLAGMLLAASLYRFRHGVHAVFCAKLHHCNQQRCIFRCNFGELDAQ